MESQIVTLEDIEAAAERIGPYIRHTPLLRQEAMGKLLGCDAYLKPEMLQITGAFKLRGAMSKILSLSPQERAEGIITSSSGNHGQACAYAGEKLGIPVTVVLPEDTPRLKVDNARRMGARVILWDRLYVKRWEKVREEVEQHGYTIVHPYEDPLVMAGQGTIAMEVLEDLPFLDTIVVPVGGGGLIHLCQADPPLHPRHRRAGRGKRLLCPEPGRRRGHRGPLHPHGGRRPFLPPPRQQPLPHH